MSSETKNSLISRVLAGEQAIVLVLLARNNDNTALLDTQLELALNMAKNVVQMTGAEVNGSGSILSFEPAVIGEDSIAKITATLEIESH